MILGSGWTGLKNERVRLMESVFAASKSPTRDTKPSLGKGERPKGNGEELINSTNFISIGCADAG